MGSVVRVDKDEALVDIGDKSEGADPRQRAFDPPLGQPGRRVSRFRRRSRGARHDEEARRWFARSFRRSARASRSRGRRSSRPTSRACPSRGASSRSSRWSILDLGVRGFLPVSLWSPVAASRNSTESSGEEHAARRSAHRLAQQCCPRAPRSAPKDERKETRQAVLLDGSDPATSSRARSPTLYFGAFVDLYGMDGAIHIWSLWQRRRRFRSEASRSARRSMSRRRTSTAILSGSLLASSRRVGIRRAAGARELRGG